MLRFSIHSFGRTWTHSNGPARASEAPLPIDFEHPDFAMWVKANSRETDEEWTFYVTYDRWHTRLGPYNGLNFCVGCHSECLENPSKDIFDTIRYFGERKRIFNIHYRNIKGGLNNFVEVFPDEGDVDMIEVAQTIVPSLKLARAGNSPLTDRSQALP